MTFNPELGEPTKIVNDNQQTPAVGNRADDVPNSTNIGINLYTIDNAVISYLNNRISPVVTQNGTMVKVPIIYGDPERWKSAQRDGVIRDSIGKIQLPVLMIRRNTMEKNTKMSSAVNKYYEREFYSGWNRRTPYDRFAVLNNITPSREYFTTTATPDYYNFTYKCMVWTEYMEQMNKVVENISFESDEFWGEVNSYKFRSRIDRFTTTTQLPINSDRVVRTEFDLNVFGYILPESQLDKTRNRGIITRKKYGIKKVVTFTEIEE